MFGKLIKGIKYGPTILVENILPKYFVYTPFLSSFYYLVFSSKFRREQHAVLKGKVKHLKEKQTEGSNFYTLVRNVHRLEKGLLMRPRRPVFALDFIGVTVSAFVSLDPSLILKDPQLVWTRDVLNEYFGLSGNHPTISRFFEIFDRYIRLNGLGSEAACARSIPYHRNDKSKSAVSYDEFYKLVRYRRSVRWFLDRKVPHDLVDMAILAANQSPSACNRQPFQYRIIDDLGILKEVANLPMGIKGYADGIPMIVVVVGNLDAYFDERDRHVIYIDASLANMSFMLALETLGLSSCSINWPDIENLEKKMEKFLGLEKFQRPIMCMAVGYPDPEGMVAYSEKRDIDQIRRYN